MTDPIVTEADIDEAVAAERRACAKAVLEHRGESFGGLQHADMRDSTPGGRVRIAR